MLELYISYEYHKDVGKKVQRFQAIYDIANILFLCTVNVPTSRSTVMVTVPHATATLASHTHAATAAKNQQNNVNKIQNWLKKC